MSNRPVVVRVHGDMDHVNRSFDQLNRHVSKTQKAVVGLSAAVGGAFAVGAVGREVADLTKQYGALDITVREAGAAAEATPAQMGAMSQAARRLGTDLSVGAVGAQQTSVVMRELARAGMPVARIIDDAAAAVTRLSQVDGANIETTALVMNSALTVFKDDVKVTADVVADQIAQLAAQTSSSVEEASESFKTGASAADLLGASITDVNVTLASLADIGIKGEMAGTTLRSAFLRLASPPKQAQDAIEKYGLSFFKPNGSIKSAVGITKELEQGLDGLNKKQQTAALKAIAGTYGFTAFSALLKKGSGNVAELTEAMGRSGVAQEMVERRLGGLGGQLKQTSANWEEAKLKMGELVAPSVGKSLVEATTLLNAGLADPQVRRSLDELGDTIGDGLVGGVTALRDGLEDGSIPDTLGQIADIAGTAADTLGDFAQVGTTVLGVVSKIPGEVVAAATAFMLWRKASMALAGGIGAVGVRGAAVIATARGIPPVVAGAAGPAAGAAGRAGGAAGGSAGGAAASAAVLGRMDWAGARVQSVAARQTAAASRAASIQAQQAAQAAERRLADAQMRAALGPTGYQRMAGRADATIAQRQLAEQRVAARNAAELAARERAAAQAASRATRMAGVRQGAAGGVVGGAVGAAMADDFTSAIAMGAAAGSIGGPWGMAGGAVAGAAAVGIKKLLATGAQKEAEELGRQIAKGTGAYLGKETRDELVKAKKEMDDKAPPKVKPLPSSSLAVSPDYQRLVEAARIREQESNPKFRAAATKYGSAAGDAYINDRLKKVDPKALSARGIAAELKKIEGLDSAAAREAAAKPIAAYLDSMAKESPRLKGAGKRLLDLLDAQRPKGTQKISLKARLELDIQREAGGARNSIEKALKRQENSILGLAKIDASKLGYDDLVKTARKRMGELQQIMKERSGTKEAAQASAEYHALKRAIERFEDDASPAIKRFGKAQEEALRKVVTGVDAAKSKLGTLADTWADVAESIANVEITGPSAPSTDPNDGSVVNDRRRRRGFREGGSVAGLSPIKASPGELYISPRGGEFIIPGQRVAADSVSMWAEDGAAILTDGQQAAYYAGASVDQALAIDAPHFANGGKVKGKVSWFGGPNDKSTRGKKTALGLSPNTPGVAIRPGATFESGRPYLGGYWDVHVGGRRSMLRQIDLGPHQSTGKRIDITSAALGRFGFNEKSFPTGSTGWAAWLGKDRAKALQRAAAGAGGGAIASDIMVAPSRRNVAGLIESSGFERGRQYGPMTPKSQGPAKAIAEALAQVQTTRRIEQESSSLGSKGSGPMGRMVAKANQIEAKRYQYAWGGGHGALGQPGRGSRHAHGRGEVGLGFDCSGAVSAVLGAGGLLKSPLTSGALMSWGKKGSGKNLAVYTDPAHVIMRLGNRFWGTSNSNPKGGPGWLSRNTMKGRGAVRTAEGFRRGGLVGGPPMPQITSPEGIRMPLMEEGFRDGGIVGVRLAGIMPSAPSGGGPVAPATPIPTGRSLLSIGNSGGDLQSRLEKVLDAIEGVTYGKLESIRRQVQAAANAGGTKRARAIAQATLSAIDDTMDVKVGNAVGRADRATNAFARNSSLMGKIDVIRGTGAEAAALNQKKIAEDFLGRSGADMAELRRAVDRAQRQFDRRGDSSSLAALDAAKAKVTEFSDSILDARVSVVEHGKAAAEAAKAVAEAAEADRKERRDNSISAAGTQASLTATTLDDAAAVFASEGASREDGWKAHLAGNEELRATFDAQAEAYRQQGNALVRKDGLAELNLEATQASLTESDEDDKAVRERRKKFFEDRYAKALADPTASVDEKQEWAGGLKEILDAIKAGNAAEQARADALLEIQRMKAEKDLLRERRMSSTDVRGLLGDNADGWMGQQALRRSGLATEFAAS